MNAAPFDERIDAVDRRIRETEPAIASEIALERQPGEARWSRSHYVATLILHDAEQYPRLSLQLATGGEQHPAPLQIGFDDADVVNLIAIPAAELLAGRPSDGA